MRAQTFFGASTRSSAGGRWHYNSFSYQGLGLVFVIMIITVTCPCLNAEYLAGMSGGRQQLKKSNGRSMQISVSMIVAVMISHSNVDYYVGGSS